MSALLILSIVGGYFTILFTISWFTSRKESNNAFFIGNKQSPWYVVAFGMIGASLSGVTFISIPGTIGNLSPTNANMAFSYMQIAMGYIAGYIVIATVLMPLYYRLNLTSIYTYLKQRFGFWSHKTGAFFFLVSRTIGAAFRLYLVALVLQTFVFDAWGIPFAINVLLTLALIWVYTLRGGIGTIVYTDTLQTTFMLLAVFTALYFIGQELNVGIGGLITTIKTSNYSQWFFFDDVNSKQYFFKQFFSGMFIAIVMTGLDQDMMQKNNSCKNIAEAQKNMFSFSIVLFFVNLLFVGLGALLYIYANAKGIAIPEKTDTLFPMLALEHFPPIMGVIFLVGLIAAAYSSADSALTALTTSFCIDFLDYEAKAEHIPEQTLTSQRYAVHIGFTVLVFCVILFFKYGLTADVIGALFRVAGYTYGPLLGLYAFGLFLPNLKVYDKLVPVVCLFGPVVSYILHTNSKVWFNGYVFGFELLIVNGFITFVCLLAITSTKTNWSLKDR